MSKLTSQPVFGINQYQWRSQPKILALKYFEFKRPTVFGLGHRVSKHNTACYAENLGWRGLSGPPATPMINIESKTFQVKDGNEVTKRNNLNMT